MRFLIKPLLVCILLMPSFITAAQVAPRIGVVLSGGGARGAAHIGVLKVLERLRIPIHSIAGTSMGALVGGVYASGMSLKEMEQRISTANWEDLFVDDSSRQNWPMRRKREAERPTWDFTIGQRNGEFWLPKGAISGQKVQLFLTDLVRRAEGITNYDQLPIPLRVVATNLENGQIKIFSSGSLDQSMRASMSVPGIFTPVEQDDALYVDGGLVRNLPVDVVRSLGVDVVIAVNLGGSYLKRDKLNNVLGITGQMITILTEQNVQRSLAELNPDVDVLIAPDLGDIESTQFNRVAEAIPLGEKAALAVLPQLQRYQISTEAYTDWQKCRLRAPPASPQVDAVRLSGLNNVNPALFAQLRQHQLNRQLDRELLEQDIQNIYGSGDFERISYRLKKDAAGYVLTIDNLEKSWGPGYLSFGLGLMHDHQGDGRFGLRGSYRQTWLNSLGAEWASDIIVGNVPSLHTELYQPLLVERRAFLAPHLDLGISPLHVYAGNNRVARYDATRVKIGLDIGTTIDQSLELRLGPYWSKQQFTIDTGNSLLPEGIITDSGLQMQAILDTLDSGYVPRYGKLWHLDYRWPLDMSGDVRYQRLYAAWKGAYTMGRDSLIVQLRGGSSFGNTMPFHEQLPLGGLFNLTGYANEQFRGSIMLYGSLAYQTKIAALPPPLGRGIYLGGGLEIGQLWDGTTLTHPTFGDTATTPDDTLYSTNVFVGADTWLGPIYMGLGFTITGNSNIHVSLGHHH